MDLGDVYHAVLSKESLDPRTKIISIQHQPFIEGTLRALVSGLGVRIDRNLLSRASLWPVSSAARMSWCATLAFPNVTPDCARLEAAAQASMAASCTAISPRMGVWGLDSGLWNLACGWPTPARQPRLGSRVGGWMVLGNHGRGAHSLGFITCRGERAGR